MALTSSVAQSGLTNTITYSGAASGTVTIYRTTDSSLTSDPASAIAAGTLTKISQKTSTSGTVVDVSEELVANETYYYIVVDSSSNTYCSVTMTTPTTALCLTDSNALLKTNQNVRAAVPFRCAVDKRYVYLLVFEADAELDAEAIAALASANQAVHKVAEADITTITGTEPAIIGSATVKYF